jgi:hypothetical protein
MDKLIDELMDYVTDYLEEESERGNKVSEATLNEALEAWMGGAR